MSDSLLVCITGASGSIYAQRFLTAALDHFSPVYLVISRRASQVIRHELGFAVDLDSLSLAGFLGENDRRVILFGPEDFSAPFASGSGACDATVVVPCSMGTTGRIASGASDDLITRAADVALKERKRLVLVPRETPLSLIHLRNLTALAEAGAVILPACPGFYFHPSTVEEMVDFVVARILNHVGIESAFVRRWGKPDIMR